MFCLSREIVLCSFITYTLAAIPQAVQWSSKSYGPNGPWQAIAVTIGTPPQKVDLLPGGVWESPVLAPSVCANNVSCDVAKAAGFYDPATSSSSILGGFLGNSKRGKYTSSPSTQYLDTISVPLVNGTAGGIVLTDVQSFDILCVNAANETLPDGTTYPIQIGTLGLGAPDFNQTWESSPQNPRINGTLLPSALFEKGLTPSNSYGLHIGSSVMGIPGSLIIGGFDQSRVLGNVSSQAYIIDRLPIDLLDVGLGVAEGTPPSNFTPQSGLLAKGNSSIGVSTTVFVEVLTPHIYLPQSACDAITASLPVTYQKKYGLYFWNTDDPNYKRLVTSPSFLSFTFRLSASISQNITIKVPFALLNLTLSAPVIKTPTLYLPLSPGPGPSGSYELGKAFLQAAFLGVNWQTATGSGPGTWFLGQAPGPNTPSNNPLTTIAPMDSKISGSMSDWKDSWKGGWTVLAETSTPTGGASSGTASNINSSNSNARPAGPPLSQNKGLTGGSIAGIAIGVAVTVLGALASGILFYKHSLAKKSYAKTSASNSWAGHDDAIAIDVKGAGPNRDFKGQPRELAAGERPGELVAEERPRELAVGERPKTPVELG